MSVTGMSRIILHALIAETLKPYGSTVYDTEVLKRLKIINVTMYHGYSLKAQTDLSTKNSIDSNNFVYDNVFLVGKKHNRSESIYTACFFAF
jgi:hypothetical protein